VIVRVVDRMSFEANVTTAQALAYCRRVLVAERGWHEWGAQTGLWSTFRSGLDREVSIPMRDDYRDWPRRLAEACDELVRLGFAGQPSEVLRAMAEEAPR
jgi:hypothetical protein